MPGYGITAEYGKNDITFKNGKTNVTRKVVDASTLNHNQAPNTKYIMSVPSGSDLRYYIPISSFTDLMQELGLNQAMTVGMNSGKNHIVQPVETPSKPVETPPKQSEVPETPPPLVTPSPESPEVPNLIPNTDEPEIDVGQIGIGVLIGNTLVEALPEAAGVGILEGMTFNPGLLVRFLPFLLIWSKSDEKIEFQNHYMKQLECESGEVEEETGETTDEPENTPGELTPEEEEAIEDVLERTKEGRETKGKSKQKEKEGGWEQANRDFDSIPHTDEKPIVDSKGGKGRTGTLSNGRNITVRPNSSDGAPTLQIPSGSSGWIKIRYS